VARKNFVLQLGDAGKLELQPQKRSFYAKMSTVTHKQGQDLGWTIVYAPETGWPTTLSGVTVTSDFVDANKIRHALTVNKNVNNLEFTLTAETDTWAIGVGELDVKMTSGGVVWYTDTMKINVIKHVTI
jgi:hypothetical protein